MSTWWGRGGRELQNSRPVQGPAPKWRMSRCDVSDTAPRASSGMRKGQLRASSDDDSLASGFGARAEQGGLSEGETTATGEWLRAGWGVDHMRKCSGDGRARSPGGQLHQARAGRGVQTRKGRKPG